MRALLTLILCLTAALGFAEVTVSVEPNVVAVGERFTLWLSNDGRNTPQIIDFPELKGIRWYPNSRSSKTEIINGRASSSVGYTAMALAEGSVEIPALKVIIGRDTVTTKPVKFEIVTADKLRQARRQQQDSTEDSLPLKDKVFAEGRFTTGERTVYIGEEVPVEVKVFVLEGTRAGMGWPELNFDKVSYHDYKAQNPENPRFEGVPRPEYAVRNKNRFVIRTFRAAIRPLATGEIKGHAVVQTEIQMATRNSRDDDFDNFFGFQSTRRVPHQLNVNFPPLKVKALPAAPAGTDFLGLIGEWKVEYKLSQDEFKAGDPFTLSLNLKGRGSLDTLNAPKLDLPGFRVYPPEVDKQSGSATIKYVIIPLRPGEDTLRMKTATFDLAGDKYQGFDFEQKVDIKPAGNMVQGASASQLVVEGAAKAEPQVKPEINTSRSNILYLKKDMSCTVSKPFYLNNFIWVLALILLGPLVFVVNEMRLMRRDKLNGSPAILRRRKALGTVGKVKRLLKNTPPEEIPRVIQTEVVPLLNDYLGLPPGTTATELADAVKDAGLAECLRNSGNAGFMPGGVSMNHTELKQKIIKALKYVSLILCLLIPAGVCANMTEDEAKAFNAYDNGDFTAAAEYFRSRVRPDKVSPYALYNLGNALCQSGKLGEALACYEKAHLLAPRDSDITENLNFVRRKLMQPEIGQISNPGDLVLAVRDSLRPDHWLLVLAGAWCCFWLGAACRRKLGFNRKLLLLITIGIITLAAGTALFTQLSGPYAGNQAVVLHNGTRLRSLPSDQSGKVERTLREGDRIQIIESRRDWILVRTDNAEGWLKSGDMDIIR